MSKYIIAVDAGTSVVKSILFGKGGVESGIVQRPVELIFPGPGLVEQDMNQIFDSVVESISELMTAYQVSSDDVLAISITAQGDGLFFVGHDGEPVMNGINWMDGRATELCIKWYTDGTDAVVYKLRGCTFYPGNMLCLLGYAMENMQEELEKTKWLVTCKEWLKFKMTGEMTLDNCYDPEYVIVPVEDPHIMLKSIGAEPLKDKLPPVKHVLDNQAPLKEELAKRLGLPAGLPVFGAPFDVTSCATGLGLIEENVSGAIIGTTCFVEVAMKRADSDPFNVGYTLPTAQDGRWIRAFGVMAGTPNQDWAIENFGGKYKKAAEENGTSVFREVDKAVAQIPPGAGGVIFHPFISPAGERAPFVKPSAKAQFFGIGLEHTTDHIMRAIFEGIGYSIMNCFDLGECSPTEIRLTGGGAKSDVWCQIIADMTGIDAIITDGKELGAKGAAIVASAALGIYPTVADAIADCVRPAKVFKPDPANTELYKKYYALYKSIYTHLWEDWDMRMGLVMGA